MKKFVMPKYSPILKKEGYVIKKFKNQKLIKDIVKVVKKNFKNSTDYYCKLSLKEFRKLSLKCQNEIIKLNIQKKFYDSEKNFLKKIFINDEIYFESVVFFRVVRPYIASNFNEAIDWHRETFYTDNDYSKYGINIWFPIMNANIKNSLKYIPKSHLINDNLIKRKKIRMSKKMKKNNPTKKFSDGHKMGFVYHPKKIISGINLKKQKSMNISVGHYSAFSAMLVHGNSKNESNRIRFAIGFGMMPKSRLVGKKIKKFNSKRLSNKNMIKDTYVSIDRLQ